MQVRAMSLKFGHINQVLFMNSTDCVPEMFAEIKRLLAKNAEDDKWMANDLDLGLCVGNTVNASITTNKHQGSR